MTVYRKWFCTCQGPPQELTYEALAAAEETEIGEPVCERCGASPSSDPKHTILYRDVEDWED